MATPEEQIDLDIKEWTQITRWMATAKQREMDLRQSIAERAFGKLPSGAFKEGTQHVTIATHAATFHAKLQCTWNRNVLEELVAATLAEAALTAKEREGLVKNKPVLSVAVYRALTDEQRLTVDKMLETKQGSITLDIVELPK